MRIPVLHSLCLLSAVFENPTKLRINAMVVLSKNRTVVLEAFFGSAKNDGKVASDIGEQVLSQFIHVAVQDVIESQNHAKGKAPSNASSDGNDDNVGGDDPILKRMNAVIELFAIGRKDQEAFLIACEKSFPELEKLIKEFKSIPSSVDRIHSKCSKIKIITGLVGILAAIDLAIACPPAAAVAAVAVTGVAVVGTSCVESRLLEAKLKQASDLVEKIQKQFEVMAEWFEFPKKLKETFEDMIDPRILTEVNEDVKIFFNNFFKRDGMTVGEKKKQLKEKVEKWVEWMSMDQKISGLDDELRAIVMTFLLVCLIKSSNQFVLISARHTMNTLLGRFGGTKHVSEFMVGAEGSMVQQGKFSHCLKRLFVPIVNIVKLIVNSTWDTKSSEIAQEINKAIPAFETSFAFLKDNYECIKKIKYMHEEDVIEWVNILVLKVPDNTQQVDIRGAVHPYLPKEAHGCIKLERLETEGNNWYVKVPKTHAEQLLKQSSIKIKNQSCLVMK